MWPFVGLVGIVAAILTASRLPSLGRVFQWLPIPLWCYLLPMLASAWQLLPAKSPAYAWITDYVLPIALGLLLFGVDFLAMRRVGKQALMAMLAGAAGIVLGAPAVLAGLHHALPAEAWKGMGALAASWTGGSFNMLAVRAVLDVPDEVFAPLVVVDAVVTYSWMACLIAGKALAPHLARWLPVAEEPPQQRTQLSSSGTPPSNWLDSLAVGAFAVLLSAACRWLAQSFPVGGLVASTTGWTILLVTTAALLLASVPSVRRVGVQGASLGYLCLYLVLASLGAQANVSALTATPVWLLVGFGCVAFHAALLLIAGRVLHVPLGVLATASQANVGGVVSAPLVGAVYHQSLVSVGLVLAILGNAIGTYLGLLSATLCRWVTTR